MKLWMYENWLADQNDNVELAKNHAYLLASFSNPEAVKKILDEDNVIESNEEDFEDTLKMIRDFNMKSLEVDGKIKKKKRKKLKV